MEGKIRRNIALYSFARFFSMAGGVFLFTSNTWQVRFQTGSALRVIETMSIYPMVGVIAGGILATLFLGDWSRKCTIIITGVISALVNFSIGWYSQYAQDVTLLISAGQLITGLVGGIGEPAVSTYLSDVGGKSKTGTTSYQLADACAFVVPAAYIWYCLGLEGGVAERYMVTHSYIVNGVMSLLACTLYSLTVPVKKKTACGRCKGTGVSSSPSGNVSPQAIQTVARSDALRRGDTFTDPGSCRGAADFSYELLPFAGMGH